MGSAHQARHRDKMGVFWKAGKGVLKERRNLSLNDDLFQCAVVLDSGFFSA
jgi:hypothetical protein